MDEAVRKNGGRYPVLQYCRDGRDLENETDVVCPYKDAASIKKRLASLDEKAVEGHKS